MTAPRPYQPQDAFRAALLAARKRFGSLETRNAIEVRKAIAAYADRLAAMVQGLPANDPAAAALRASEFIQRSAAVQLERRIQAAIAESRAVTFHEIQDIWRDASQRVAKLAGVPQHLMGAVRNPPVSLLGAMEQASPAGNWKTLLRGHVQNAAGDAQAVIRQALLEGIGPEELAKRLRFYVQGSAPFHHLFTRVPGKNGDAVTINLARIPRELRGKAGQMQHNARRIAYSELANARHEANLQQFAADPLVYAVQWHTAPDRGKTVIPDACDVLRDTDYFGLGAGIYPLSAVPPLPHPFDRCLAEPLTRPVREAAEAKPQPPLQLDPAKASSPGLRQLSQPARDRVVAQATAAVRFGEAGGWNPQAGQQLTQDLKQILDDQARRARGAVRVVVGGRPSVPATPPTPTPAPAPRGKPVSVALKIPRSTQAAPLRRAAQVIDAVHGDGNLPVIPIRQAKLRAGYHGEYRFLRSGRALGIRNRNTDDVVTKTLTILHEVGHLLDHQTMGVQGTFASQAWRRLDEWRSLVLNTNLVRHLEAIRGRPGVSEKHRRYLLDVRELWARSYAQWVAKRSGESDLSGALQARRANDPLYQAGQWDPADFAPIVAAIDRLMETLGWRQSTP